MDDLVESMRKLTIKTRKSVRFNDDVIVHVYVAAGSGVEEDDSLGPSKRPRRSYKTGGETGECSSESAQSGKEGRKTDSSQ